MPTPVVLTPITISGPDQPIILRTPLLAEGTTHQVSGTVRFTSSIPGQCIRLHFGTDPEGTMTVGCAYQTGADEPSHTWTHTAFETDGVAPDEVDEANRVYMVQFSGMVSSLDSSTQLCVYAERASAASDGSTIEVLPGSCIITTLAS